MKLNQYGTGKINYDLLNTELSLAVKILPV